MFAAGDGATSTSRSVHRIERTRSVLNPGQPYLSPSEIREKLTRLFTVTDPIHSPTAFAVSDPVNRFTPGSYSAIKLPKIAINLSIGNAFGPSSVWGIFVPSTFLLPTARVPPPFFFFAPPSQRARPKFVRSLEAGVKDAKKEATRSSRAFHGNEGMVDEISALLGLGPLAFQNTASSWINLGWERNGFKLPGKLVGSSSATFTAPFTLDARKWWSLTDTATNSPASFSSDRGGREASRGLIQMGQRAWVMRRMVSGSGWLVDAIGIKYWMNGCQ